ncbi:MAG: TIGR02452 family protein [Spirochaetia bacterium]|jgi:uncharacterized protein (TIGR02452 family)|nr:TIGR02452 family protein [Spirochaetia bacterium]
MAWNSEIWLADYENAVREKDWQSKAKLLKAVFASTLVAIREGNMLPASPSLMIKGPLKLPFSEEHKTKIHVVREDCLAAARKLRNRYTHVAVLNMASPVHAGGGVKEGSGAQEEYLCRCSNYYPSLIELQDQYPLDARYGGIFTGNVTVFRDTQAHGYRMLDTPFSIDIIAVAAMDHPLLLPDGRYAPDAQVLTERKIRTIFDIALSHGEQALVLEAFGCGVFANPPYAMARAFGNVLKEKPYHTAFEEIVFAILEDANSPAGGNFLPFEEILGRTFS